MMRRKGQTYCSAACRQKAVRLRNGYYVLFVKKDVEKRLESATRANISRGIDPKNEMKKNERSAIGENSL